MVEAGLVRIRRVTMNDLGEIERFNELWLKEDRDYRRSLGDVSTLFLIAEDDENQMLGFTSATYNSWNNSVWLNQIVTHAEHRRRGLASELLARVTDFAQKKRARVILIECGLENKGAQLFYLKNNARICGYNDRYYARNVDKGTAVFFSIDIADA